MSHKFSVKTPSFIVSLGVVAAFALVSPIKQAEAEAKTVECGKLDAKAYPAVADLCSYVGGKEAAIKGVMKDAQKAYKAKNGDKIENCKGCHEGANGGALNDEAKGLWPDFKPYFDTALAEYKKANPAAAK